MNEVADGFVRALRLIVSLDPDVIAVTGRSLAISTASCTIAAALALPAGGLIHFRSFPGKRALIGLIQTLYGLPTVAVGLLVFVLLSRGGPLGGLGLLFTPAAIVAGQVVLIAPLMLGLTLAALRGTDPALAETALSLGASRVQTVAAMIREARFALVSAAVLGFGRAVSEVGISLIVGGNIRGFTRTLTTAISLETSRGDVELAFALGILLMLIALVVNLALNRLQGR